MKKLLSCTFCILLAISAFAQSDFKFYNDVSIPKTDAYNFVTHGEITPSLYTGTVNFSLPIYTYQDNDFNLPIVLTYSSNGNKPNQRAGILGPGWSLELGGCITLETRGIADYGRNLKNVPGFLTLHDTTLLTSAQTDHWWRFMYQYDGTESGSTCPQIVYTPNNLPSSLHTNEYDAEPDLFHFNFMGHSGSFHLDYNHNIVVLGTSGSPLNYKVELKKHAFQNAQDYNRIDTITITSSDGYRYQFVSDEVSMDLNRERYSLNYNVISAWHLKRVTAPNGRTMTFTYVQHNQSSYAPGSSINSSNLKDNIYRTYDLEQFAYFPGDQEDPNKIFETKSKNAFLTSVTIDGGAAVTLNYSLLSSGDQYRNSALANASTYTYNDTYRLSGITVTYAKAGGGTNTVAQAALAYTGNTNGARTNYLTSVTVSGEGTYTMQYNGFNGSLAYPFNGTVNIDHFGYYNGTGSTSYYPQTSVDSNTQEETIIGTNRNPNATYAQLGLLSRLGYPTGGYTLFEYEPNDYSLVVARPFDHQASLSGVPTITIESGTTAGLRLKAVRSYLSNNTLFLEKKYTYTDSNGSSGTLAYVPRYSIQYSASVTAIGGTITDGATYKSSNIQSYNTTHIEYRRVTEHIKDSSRIVYTFTSSAYSPLYRDRVILQSAVMEPFATPEATKVYWSITNSSFTPARVHSVIAPVTSYQSVRGMPVDKVIYGSETSDKPLSWEHTEYNTSDSTLYTMLPCYLVRKFALYGVLIGNYPASGTVIRTYSQERGTSTTDSTAYTYNDYKEPVVVRQTLPSGDTLVREYVHLRDLPSDSISVNAVYGAMVAKNLLSTTISEMVYLKRGSVKTLIDGRRCHYNPFGNGSLVKPQSITRYYLGEGWKTEVVFNSYDSFGNITQLTSADGVTTSYLWGFGGQMLLAQAVGLPYSTLAAAQTGSDGNITAASKSALTRANPKREITFIDYDPGYGVTLLSSADGSQINYTYTQWRKLQNTVNALSNARIERMDYSNEYNQ